MTSSGRQLRTSPLAVAQMMMLNTQDARRKTQDAREFVGSVKFFCSIGLKKAA